MAMKRAIAGPTIESQILQELTEVRKRVDESLGVGRDNGNELKMLRRELGLDGPHGRLPIVEAQLLRHENSMTSMATRIDMLEAIDSESKGKAKLMGLAIGLAGGGGGGGLVMLIIHLLK